MMEDDELGADAGAQDSDIAPAETIADETPIRQDDEGTAQAPPAENEGDAGESEGSEEHVSDGDSAADGDGDKAEEKPAKPKLDWKERRRIEETIKRREAEAERDRLKAELEALKAGKKPDDPETPNPYAGLTPEQARAAARRDLEQEQHAAAFRDATGRVLKAGQAAFPNFEDARKEAITNFGDQFNQRPDFFEALIGLEPEGMAGADVEKHRARVFYDLARDPERMEQMLSLPPLKMAMEMTRLSDKLAKPTAKPISKAPAPVVPVNGAPQSSGRLEDPKLPDAEFSKQLWGMIKAKGY